MRRRMPSSGVTSRPSACSSPRKLLAGSDLTATGPRRPGSPGQVPDLLASLGSEQRDPPLGVAPRRRDALRDGTARRLRRPLPAAAIDPTADAAIVPLAESRARSRPLNDRADGPARAAPDHQHGAGTTLGELTIWRDAGPILAKLDAVRLQVVLVTLSAAAVAAVLLFLIFRSAQKRLTRQTAELVEATRRDPLTGTYNHGALVSLLAGRMEASKATGEPDRRRAHRHRQLHPAQRQPGPQGRRHRAHDRAGCPRRGLPDRDGHRPLWPGRVPGHRAARRPRRARAGHPGRRATPSSSAASRSTPRIGIPITISAGIATYPHDGASLTVLLATVASTLGAAKASGGNEIRVTGADGIQDGSAATFDVLQGLVFAVDTKDRYTKRHSEDVARYAVFLAQQAGLDETTVGVDPAWPGCCTTSARSACPTTSCASQAP